MSLLATSSELLTILTAIKEEPEEDTSRLVLADWLDERGDADRAEFIRLQCRLATDIRNGKPPRERQEVSTRIEDLFDRHGGAWCGPLWRCQATQHDWYRGLLTVRLGRCPGPRYLADVLPWVDTVHVEVHGQPGLDQTVALLNTGTLNHVTLNLRRYFSPKALLAQLGLVRESIGLRTLTLWWARPSGRRPASVPSRPLIATLDQQFLTALLRELPLGRHLTHVALGPRLTRAQTAWLRSLGVAPVAVRSTDWTRGLPPSLFGCRQLGKGARRCSPCLES